MAVVAGSGLLWLLAWNVADTDARIAAANLGRVAVTSDVHGRDRFDGASAATLSDDAVPTLVDRFEEIPVDEQPEVRTWICNGPRTAPSGLSWNRAASAATEARREFCR
jgi:hypothetical protein